MNGFTMIGERIVDGWRFDSLEQARDTFQKHLIAWFSDAIGAEHIYVRNGRARYVHVRKLEREQPGEQLQGIAGILQHTLHDCEIARLESCCC